MWEIMYWHINYSDTPCTTSITTQFLMQKEAIGTKISYSALYKLQLPYTYIISVLLPILSAERKPTTLSPKNLFLSLDLKISGLTAKHSITDKKIYDWYVNFYKKDISEYDSSIPECKFATDQYENFQKKYMIRYLVVVNITSALI